MRVCQRRTRRRRSHRLHRFKRGEPQMKKGEPQIAQIITDEGTEIQGQSKSGSSGLPREKWLVAANSFSLHSLQPLIPSVEICAICGLSLLNLRDLGRKFRVSRKALLLDFGMRNGRSPRIVSLCTVSTPDPFCENLCNLWLVSVESAQSVTEIQGQSKSGDTGFRRGKWSVAANRFSLHSLQP